MTALRKRLFRIVLPAVAFLIALFVAFISFEYSYVAEVREWLAGSSTMTVKQRGKLLFETRGCNGCHSLARSRFQGIGPSLHPDDLAMAPADIREAILYPNRTISDRCGAAGRCRADVMPAYEGMLDDGQVEDLVAYLSTER